MTARGFTLIEVLVALAIVAVTLAAGLRAASALGDNAQRLSDVIAAQWCAEDQLVELRVLGTLPGVGESDFSCQQLGRVYRGRLLVRAAPFNANLRHVYAVMSDERGMPLLTLVTMLSRL
jgi:general secretion pathway protein I